MMNRSITTLISLAMIAMPVLATAQEDPYAEEEKPAGESVTETETDVETDADAGPETEVEPETDAGLETDAETETEVEPEAEPVLEEPYIPPLEDDRVDYDDDALEEALENIPDGKPFGKGDMELGVGLGMSGYGDQYYMMLGAAFGYYVINGLAPGIDINYTTDFGSTDFSDSITLLPFLKWVFYRSHKFSPYIIGGAGREFQWAGAFPVHSWLAGLGFGAHIGIGSHVVIKIQMMFLHHWYDDPMVKGWPDDKVFCGNYVDGNGDDTGILAPETCTTENNDVNREWIYPIITLGVSFMF